MSAKQDRVYTRTASDLERKYQFGKTFSEIIGLIDDTRKDVDSTASELRSEIIDQSTSITRNTEQIVMQAEQRLTNTINDVDGKLTDIEQEVSLKMSADDVSIAVREEVSGGIELESGYRFDTDGLTISRKGNEMENLIDHTGMYVKKDAEAVLTANKDGVEAVDLHAKTYLIIGSGDGRSRFEDYGLERTGCFWIG